jgi:hypothetical protein
MVHHLRQTGVCVWWIAYSTWPGTEPGDVETLAFAGRVLPDLTLDGSFSPIVRLDDTRPYGFPASAGHARFEIAFDDAGEPSQLELLGDESSAPEAGLDYIPELIRLGPLPDPVAPPQQD